LHSLSSFTQSRPAHPAIPVWQDFLDLDQKQAASCVQPVQVLWWHEKGVTEGLVSSSRLQAGTRIERSAAQARAEQTAHRRRWTMAPLSPHRPRLGKMPAGDR